MKPTNTIDLGLREFKLNNQILKANLIVELYPEVELPSGDFEASDLETIVTDINSGKCDYVTVLVKAEFEGEVGTDSLGCVVLYSEADLNETLVHYSMIDNALDDLVDVLKERYKTLSKYFKKD